MTVHDAEQPRRILTCNGRFGGLYRIFLLNLLLTIVTVGIWRFWAGARMRRYVWSRTSSLGDPFEYDSTGGQLFLGWVLAVGVLIGLVLAAVVLGILLRGAGPVASVLPVLASYPVVFVLALGGPVLGAALSARPHGLARYPRRHARLDDRLRLVLGAVLPGLDPLLVPAAAVDGALPV